MRCTIALQEYMLVYHSNPRLLVLATFIEQTGTKKYFLFLKYVFQLQPNIGRF